MHLAAKAKDFLAHGLDNAHQLVRADMRLGIHQDLLRRAEAHERAQDVLAARVLGAGVQLAVGERACAALAELDVGGRLECGLAVFPVRLHVARARVHVLTAFEHDGACAGLRQRQRGEQAGRTETHDDGPEGGHSAQLRDGRRRIGDGEPALAGRKAGADALFILRIPERHVKGDDKADVVLLSRVDALFADFAAGKLSLRAAELLAGGLREGFLCIIQRNFDVMQTDHGESFLSVGMGFRCAAAHSWLGRR